MPRTDTNLSGLPQAGAFCLDRLFQALDTDVAGQDYNIRTAAKFFADTLAGDNGNIIISIGRCVAVNNVQCARYTEPSRQLQWFPPWPDLRMSVAT